RYLIRSGIEQRFTKPAHPWTNSQVERMNRTIKEATVQRYHYQTMAELNHHLQTFLLAYNHAKWLKTLRGLTLYEFICAEWQVKPTIFIRNPTQFTLGLYTTTGGVISGWGKELVSSA
ncbi:MAG: IS481 family transposase, partial [Cytophagaceae bacterium]